MRPSIRASAAPDPCKPVRCAIYARFSSDRQSETSADDQVRDCRRFADREGWTVADVYTDLAVSGARNRRPGLSGLLSAVAEGRYDVVLAEDLDRIARDQEDIASFFKRVQFAGARIHTLAAGEVNELHIGLKGTMDALELKKIAEKVRRGQRGAVARGHVPGGLAYGYRVVRRLDGKGELIRGLREVDPEKATIIVRVLGEYAEGRSPKAICRDLNRDGVPGPAGGAWHVSAILGNRARRLGLLHNPIYVGQLVYNRVRMVRDPETRNRLSRPNPDSELETVELPHLRIVDDDLWGRVQERRLAAAAVQPLHKRRRPRHLLSGLMRCGSCGGAYTVYAARRVACVAHRGGGLCANGRTLLLAEVQRRVLAGLERELLSADAIALLLREYHIERARTQARGGGERKSIERRLRESEAAVGRLVAAIAEGGGAFPELRQALSDRSADRDRLRAQLDDIDSLPVIALHPRIEDAYRARVAALLAGFDPAAVGEQTAAELRALITRIIIAPAETGGVTIELQGSLAAIAGLATASGSRKGRVNSVLVVAEEGLMSEQINGLFEPFSDPPRPVVTTK